MAEVQPARDLEELSRNESWLRPMVRALVGDDAASDVLQRTWLQAWRHRPQQPAVRGWLVRVATRLAMSHRRAEHRRRRHETSLPPPEPAPSAAATVERLSVQRAVSTAVSELAEPYRTAVLLRHYHGLSVDEVARRTGTTSANVRQRTRRGLRAMRERLDRDLGGEWRAAPAVIALAGLQTARPASLSPLVLLLMHKLRLLPIVTLLVGFAAIAMLWPEHESVSVPSAADGERVAAMSTPRAPSPPPSTPTVRTEVAAAATPAGPACRGIVRDLDGRPVAQVAIGVVGMDRHEWRPLARSQADGTFVFVGAWPIEPLRAEVPWYAIAVSPTGPEHAEAEALVVVVPARDQIVVVRGPDGAPIDDSTAIAHEYGLVDYPGVLDDMIKLDPPLPRRGSNGDHHWTQLPLARTFVTITRPGYRPITVEVSAATPSPLEVTLQPLARGERVVTGVVTDRRGALMVAATVGLGDRRTCTDANGAYTFTLEAGAGIGAGEALYAVAPGWYPTIVPGFGHRLQADATSPLTADLQLAHAAVVIRGRVVDHEGRPQGGVYVYPWQLANLTSTATAEDLAAPADREPLSLSGNEVRAFARTAADGTFELQGLDRRPYRLRVYSPDPAWAWTSPPVEGGAGDVAVVLPPDVCGTVSGTVRTRDGAPAVGVTVGCYLDVHANGGGVAAVGLPMRTVTDADGRFTLAAMPRHGASLAFSGSRWVEEQLPLDPARGTIDLSLTVDRRCHVRVCLVDPAWAAATIQFLDAAGQPVAIHEDRANLHMTTSVYPLHGGKTQVISVSEVAVAIEATVTTATGDRTRRFDIALQPGEVATLTL